MRRRKPTGPARASAGGDAIWREVAAALTPVIGVLGFDALFGRSLRAVSADFPWLAEAGEGVRDPLAAFERVLARQAPAAAAAAQAALQRTFAQLLDNLVGAALAQRLLRDRVKEFPLARTLEANRER
jgi:hypothetical protein